MTKPMPIPPSVTETDQDHETIRDLTDLGNEPRTDLGKLALAARHAYFADGGIPLTIDQITAEVAEQRGGIDHLDDR
jgi:hypothetical protein